MAQHDDFWSKAASDCGYAVGTDGVPLIGISPDEGDGFIVPVPAPTWFAQVRDEGARKNVFRALAAHALRVGQSKVKAADKPTRQTAADGVASAINGSYEPGRSRDNDIVGSTAARMFSDFIAGIVRQSKPNATDAEIKSTVDAEAETERGKAKLAAFSAQVLESGIYPVQRRGKGTSADKVAVEY